MKKFLSTPKGQLIAALSALGAVWLVLLLYFGGEFISELPSAENLVDSQRELKRQRQQLAKAREDETRYNTLRLKYTDKIRSSWRESEHGMVETRLRQIVSETATALELRPNSLGTVRTSRINEDFYYAEIDVTMNTSFEEVIKFIAALDKVKPKLSWRRCDLRPDMRRRNQARNNTNLAAARAAAIQAQNSVNVMFNGVIRVIGYDGSAVVTPVKNSKKAAVQRGNK